jgi:hypothetical protein
MGEETGVYIRGMEHLSPDERYRFARAKQICEQVSQEVGFEMDFLEQVAACVDFVHGNIEEPELWEKARMEVEQRTRT